MIRTLTVKDFQAVPYLETSLLMRNHPTGLIFSTEKPNVIVGPNGSGKSALLKALALETLSYYTGQSNFDNNYIDSNEASSLWSKTHEWSNDHHFLKGRVCFNDRSPAIYYHSNFIPGNKLSVGHAMMTGYSKEAHVYRELVRNKSSGQQNLSVQDKMFNVMETGDLEYTYTNWKFGKTAREIDTSTYVSRSSARAEILKARYIPQGTWPLVIMDEPEQSLDALAESLLWERISNIDCARVQLIIASHSLHPIIYTNRFNLIEATPDYVNKVRELI